jgi:uncharacterized membrane protein YphA (DoxX/SURF4 family)
VERYFGWLLVAARLLVAIVFLLNGFGIIDQTIPAREMIERGLPAGIVLNNRMQMRASRATRKAVTLTKQVKIGPCEQVRVN